MSGPFEVRTGHWIDHSYSGLEAQQWTLKASHAALMLTGIATFIGVVSTQFWSLTAFFIHLVRSTRGPHDALHHAHQAIVRNNGAPLGVAWAAFKIDAAYSGRGEWYNLRRTSAPATHRQKRRVFILSTVAVVCWAAFRVAAVLSARVTLPPYRASEVLIEPYAPGFITINTAPGTPDHDWQIFWAWTRQQGLSYVNSCYNTTSDKQACSSLPRQELKYTTVEEQKCPFGGLCKVPALTMSTDWLDSHKDLGINAPPQDRMSFRKQATCAVLDTSGLTTTATRNGAQIVDYMLGPAGPTMKITEFAIDRLAYDRAGYDLSTSFHRNGMNDSWQPIPQLTVDYGDMSLIFVHLGNVAYTGGPVDDPLFAAHNTTKLEIEDGPLYYSDAPAGVVACVDRVELRDPTGQKQSVAAGAGQLLSAVRDLGLSKEQLATAIRILWPLQNTQMYTVPSSLGTAALQARQYVADSLSTGLPRDQYLLELQGWFAVNLAVFQHSIVDFASKRFMGILQLDNNVTSINENQVSVSRGFSDFEDLDAQFQAMAKQQKIRNVAGNHSFSVLGVGTIAGVGGLIIGLSWVLEPLALFLARCCGRRKAQEEETLTTDSESEYRPYQQKQLTDEQDGKPINSRRLRQWQLDSVFHLQRLAYPVVDQGRWSRCNEEVPVASGIIRSRLGVK